MKILMTFFLFCGLLFSATTPAPALKDRPEFVYCYKLLLQFKVENEKLQGQFEEFWSRLSRNEVLKEKRPTDAQRQKLFQDLVEAFQKNSSRIINDRVRKNFLYNVVHVAKIQDDILKAIQKLNSGEGLNFFAAQLQLYVDHLEKNPSRHTARTFVDTHMASPTPENYNEETGESRVSVKVPIKLPIAVEHTPRDHTPYTIRRIKEVYRIEQIEQSEIYQTEKKYLESLGIQLQENFHGISFNGVRQGVENKSFLKYDDKEGRIYGTQFEIDVARAASAKGQKILTFEDVGLRNAFGKHPEITGSNDFVTVSHEKGVTGLNIIEAKFLFTGHLDVGRTVFKPYQLQDGLSIVLKGLPEATIHNVGVYFPEQPLDQVNSLMPKGMRLQPTATAGEYLVQKQNASSESWENLTVSHKDRKWDVKAWMIPTDHTHYPERQNAMYEELKRIYHSNKNK